MALRNQPYLPLYVQDYLTDEKLNLCSLSTQGVYIKLMCIMHKSEEYGTILLKQKDKQSSDVCFNFASKIAKLIPLSVTDIHTAIKELLEEKVLFLGGDKLIQRRMVKDNSISEIRAKAGKKGGQVTQSFDKAKTEANSENENDIESEDKNVLMRNSRLALVDLEAAFSKTDDINKADVKHYYHTALDWSNSKGAKRIDWIATIKNFARSDLAKGQLVKKPYRPY